MTKRIVLLFCLFFFFLQGGRAQLFTQNGLAYFLEDDGTLSVSDIDRDVPILTTMDGTLYLCASINFAEKSYFVTQVKRDAFLSRPEIKHLILGEGIRYIGVHAFSGCVELLSVHIPSTFECMACHEFGLFDGCSKLCKVTVDDGNEEFDSRDSCNAIIETESNTLFFGCLGTKIPASVTTIGADAFRGCQGIEDIQIPEGVAKIEDRAFAGCVNLKNISLPSTLITLGGYVFSDCMSIEKIIIPVHVASVRGSLFAGCYNLKEVIVEKENIVFDSREKCNAIIDTKRDILVAGCGNSHIPMGIKEIAPYAFSGSSIHEIIIPKSIKAIGSGAFLGTRFCGRISVDSENPRYNSDGDCNAIVETSSRKLIQGCSRTTIRSEIKEIADSAFYQIPLTPYLNIPEGVEVIGSRAFTRSCGLERVQMPSTMRRIKVEAFTCCDKLCFLDMSQCSADVGTYAFGGCSSLFVVSLSENPGRIEALAFSGCPCETQILKFVRSKSHISKPLE